MIGLPARRDGGVEQFVVALALVGFVVVEGGEGIAAGDGALEIDVIGEDAHEIVDDRSRNLLFQGCLVERIVKPHAIFVVGLVRRRLLGRVRGRHHAHVIAVVVDGDAALHGVVGVDGDASQRRWLAGAVEIGEKQLHAASFGCDGFAGFQPEGGADGGDLRPAHPRGAQDVLKPLAVADDDQPLVRLPVLRRLRRTRHVRDVLGNHADLDRRKRRRLDLVPRVRIGEHAGEIGAAGAHEEQLRRQRDLPRPGFRRILQLLGDLRLNLVDAEPDRRQRIDGDVFRRP